jgi:hypothetical protein
MAEPEPASRRRRQDNAAREYLVFVSHATSDKWLAKVICEKIEATGATTFRDDRDIDGGDDIPEIIRHHIRQCKEMVILLTPDSVARQWVLWEVGAFWGRRQNQRIVAVLCHVTVDSIPEMIRSKKAMAINDFDQYTQELRQRVQRRKP